MILQEHIQVLQERAVAYLHMTYACEHSYVLEAHISPLLQDVLYDAAKKVYTFYIYYNAYYLNVK